jgi:hypothetical protein
MKEKTSNRGKPLSGAATGGIAAAAARELSTVLKCTVFRLLQFQLLAAWWSSVMAIRVVRGIDIEKDRLSLRRKNMLGFIALVLIALWLLGFLAFYVSSALIHVLLA